MAPYDVAEETCVLKSRRVFIMLVLAQTTGLCSTILLVNSALKMGALGHVICMLLVFTFMGIPMLYMEMIVSQFTGRDSYDVWTIRPCLSHIGAVQAVWQFIILLTNHSLTSFIFYYLLISFESPLPYYTCGQWAAKNCNILLFNYTVHRTCHHMLDDQEYYNYGCNRLYTTFPEYNYWNYYMFNNLQSGYTIAWRICLASFLVSTLDYVCLCKRIKSLAWFINIFIAIPVVGYTFMFFGSMLQKGLVSKYEDALDVTFEVFSQKYSYPHVVNHVVNSLGIGTGIMFNLSSVTSFRAPCYANTVISIALSGVFFVCVIFTVGFMTCPYVFEHNLNPGMFILYDMSLIFEKIPRMIFQFSNSSFWLIVFFISTAASGVCGDVVILYSLLEMVYKRSPKAAQYPGLISLLAVFVVYVLTVPLLSNIMAYLFRYSYRRIFYLVSIFLATIESFVFIAWYGFERFSEDVHFMQGIRPKMSMKAVWLFSSVILAHVFICELYDVFSDLSNSRKRLGLYIIMTAMVIVVGVLVVRLLVAAVRKKFLEALQLDPTWGPKNEVLMRSRAMFTAQAMTKEYMYRQYHLQAGIMARQQRANIRCPLNELNRRNNFKTKIKEPITTL